MSEIPVVNPLRIASFSGDPAAGAPIGSEQRRAVQDLIFSYSYNWDSRDPAATASLFTEDADVAFFLNGATEASSRTTGRAELAAAMTARSDLLARWRVETRHLMTNTVFAAASDAVEGDEVEAMTTAVIFWQQLPEHPAPTSVQTGYYRSWCVETDTGWLFRRRETHMSGIFHPKQLYERSV